MTTEPDNRPAWQKHYVCPQCPSYAQPKEGFNFVAFQDHVNSHAINGLRDTFQDAHQYHYAIQSINDILRSDVSKDWPSAILRVMVQHHVDQALRWMDRAYFDKSLEERERIREGEPRTGVSVEESTLPVTKALVKGGIGARILLSHLIDILGEENDFPKTTAALNYARRVYADERAEGDNE